MQDHTDEEVQQVLIAYFDGGRRDVKLRDEIVRHYFPLTLKVAAKEARRIAVHVDGDAFESWAQGGLLRAVANYDPYPRQDPKTGKTPARPVTFATYAVASMRSVIMDGLRSLDWAPRSLRTRQRQIDQTRSRLSQDLGRTALDSEVAAELGIEAREIQQTDAETAHSWHTYIEEQRDQLAAAPAPETLEPEEQRPESAMILAAVGAEMTRLSDIARTVLALHYFEELPLDEVARTIGVSAAYVSSVHSQAVLQVHEAMLRSVGVTPLPVG